MIWRGLCLVFLLAIAATAQPRDDRMAAPADDMAAHFYTLHGTAPVWSGSTAALANRQVVLTVLAHAAREGLDASRYAVAPGDDAAVTAVLLTYMRDVAVGRPDLQALDHDVLLPPRAFDAPALLDQALRRGDLAAMLAGLPPHSQAYDALRQALTQTTESAMRDTIAANMERWRWLPPQLEADRIVINAADAQLQLWLGGTLVLQSRVIVGKPATPTPILRAEGAGVTVNPAWTVPQSIAAKELLPKLKKNRNYLASQNMVLLDGPAGDPHGLSVDWREIPAGHFPYRVRQLPGGHNSLGLVKLELPNRFDVYLHDTPARSLFGRADRALSHGCVRVEQILPLASYALAADGSAMAKIHDAIGTGQTRYLPLARHLPVYFLYWTALPGEQGPVLLPDIYGRDARLIAAMRRPNLQIAARDTGCMKG